MSTSFDTPKSLRTIADENLQGAKNKHGSATDRIQRFPDLKRPLRVELPAYFNTPCRLELKEPETETKTLPGIRPNLVEAEERIRIQKRLRDYQLLALACKRAKKPKVIARKYVIG